MGTPRLRIIGLAALGAALVAGFAGCDLQESADLENGRTAFIEQCGTCHALAEANTTSPRGPDLDAAFADARASGMTDETIEGVVADQIQNPRQVRNPEENPTYMPPDLVTGEDLEDVSAYVGSVAGVPGIEPPEAPGGPGGQVFADNGCGACHTLAAAQATGTTGPNLDEVLPGQSKAAIEESIVNPDADITSGFSAGIMPSNYGESISPDDMKLLVDFLFEDAGAGGGGQGGGGQ